VDARGLRPVDRPVRVRRGNGVRFRGAQFYGTYRGFRQRGPVTELLRQRFYYPPDSDHRAAAESFRRALRLAQVGPEQLYLTRMLERTQESVSPECG